jgi:PKD repeat protein
MSIASRLDVLVSKKVALAILAFIIVAGVLVGFYTLFTTNTLQSNNGLSFAPASFPLGGYNGNGNLQSPATTVTMMATTSASMASPSTQVIVTSNQQSTTTNVASSSTTQGDSSNSHGMIEFFSNVTLQVVSPANTMRSVTALAYSKGGYVAYSYQMNTSALAVLRIPAENYQIALDSVESFGNVTYISSTSNDVSVKYTDLNATLQSLLSEEASLIRLMNESNSVNETLIIENQLQGVNAQINAIQSSMLQTRTLIDYSTISITMNLAQKPPPPAKPLVLKVSATPTSGQSPLSVTFNAIVTGGVAPYIVNYNFGDGTSAQGQSLIHQFYGDQPFNVTVSVTDQAGNVSTQYLTIKVTTPAANVGLSMFTNTVVTLFVSVIEGIAEVAVVVLPLLGVAAVIILPIRYRSKMSGARKASKPAEGSSGP